MKMIPETAVDHLLVCIKEKYGTQAKAAEALGVSTSFLSSVLHEHRPMTPRLLDLIGWERVVVYRPKEAQ
jgi:hypothetical protein